MKRLADLVLPGVLLVVGLTACDTGTGARVPDSLEIQVASTEILEGQDLTLEAVAVSGGESWAPEVEWTSGNPNTVLVTGDGVAHGLRTGSAWIHASVAGVRDSVRILVRFRQLYPGEIGYRLGFEDPLIRIINVGATYFDHLVGTGDVTQIQGQVFQGPEVVISSPGLLAPGDYDLQPIDPNTLYDGAVEPDFPALGTFVVLITPREGSFRAYVPQSGVLRVESFEVPAEPSRRSGTGRGFLLATVAEYDVDGLASGRPRFEATGVTEEMMMEFNIRPLHWPVGDITTSLAGGPVTGDAAFPWAFATAQFGRIHVAHDGRFDGGAVPFSLDLYIGDVATGTFAVDSVGPEVFNSRPPDSVTWAGLILDFIATDGLLYGFSRSGSVTISSLDLPTDPLLFGVMTGSQTIELVIREPGTNAPTGETTTLTSTFTLPVQVSGSGAALTPAFCSPGRRCRGN